MQLLLLLLLLCICIADNCSILNAKNESQLRPRIAVVAVAAADIAYGLYDDN